MGLDLLAVVPVTRECSWLQGHNNYIHSILAQASYDDLHVYILA
jgi:hypothetical protein